jgi:uncharacterized protein (DUF3084 family)
MGTALVVGLLVGMCGVIAYVGDLLGRRMGKKRLSLFGLRPRHTAVVFTVITGMMIAGLTLAVLFFASAGVRFALTRGEQLVQSNRRLTQQRKKLFEQGRRLWDQNQTLGRLTRELEQRNANLLTEGVKLRKETTRLASRNGELQTKNRTLGARNGNLEGRNTRLAGENQGLMARNARLAGENGRLADAKRGLARANQQLRLANAGIKSQNRGLQIAKEGLEKGKYHAQQELTRALRGLTTAKDELAKVLQEQKRAIAITEDYRQRSERAAELETGQVVVRAGGELARRVITPGTPAEQVRRAIEELLNESDAEVARRETQVTPRRVSGARPRRVRLAGTEESADRLVEAMVARLLTESHTINGQPPAYPMPEIHSLVLRAVARTNAAAGTDEPVVVDVVGKVNMLAYRRGQEIASLPQIPTASTTGQLLKTLIGFLQGQVRESAMARSVLPDARGQVGEMDPEALLDVVARVKRLPGNARIGAVASEDVWSAGPLRLDFFVVPADTQVAREKREGEE